ncbi:hypothetical protein [Cobetia crustatorum]|uniref:hypothetical protein n=1 Tax=Cobetia crustatorum TaxID=553385 RepID=UPI0012ECB1DA|nr:hypothetical protein [Cobetia crustatorum]
MTPRRLVAAISIAACSLAYGVQASAVELPGVKIYATGGTIAGSSASSPPLSR